MWTDTLLQRTPASPTNSPSLGELLVQKANQGVAVRGGPGQPSHVCSQLGVEGWHSTVCGSWLRQHAAVHVPVLSDGGNNRLWWLWFCEQVFAKLFVELAVLCGCLSGRSGHTQLHTAWPRLSLYFKKTQNVWFPH